MRRTNRGRSGFTLIEVMLALVILTGSLLGMGAFMARFSHNTATTAAMSLASDLAVARIETVKGAGDYAALEADYEGTATSAEHPSYAIATDIIRTESDTADYTTVTVAVTAPALDRAVRKTTIISAF
jgi:prepilin-type N-terminal cleavage/methylation domain-containing protein